MARAEAWAQEAHLELGIDLGVAYLCEKRLREVPLEEGPWDERAWEFSEPLVVMPRPEGISDRVVAATLAAMLWKTDPCTHPVHLPG